MDAVIGANAILCRTGVCQGFRLSCPALESSVLPNAEFEGHVNYATSFATTRLRNGPRLSQRLVRRAFPPVRCNGGAFSSTQAAEVYEWLRAGNEPQERDTNLPRMPEGQRFAVTQALEALDNNLSGDHDGNPPVVQQKKDRRPGLIKRAIGTLSQFVLDALFDALYKPSEEYVNVYFSENFGPVEEIGAKVRVHTISGAIPKEFPAGTYIRTGPNPVFGGKFMVSPLGITKYHWFEGDGMLHATYFEKRGETFDLFYRNKYVETEGYLIEKKTGKPTILAIMEATPILTMMNPLLNQLRHGFLSKQTCNTSVFCHGGRVFAAAENGLPYEINVSDLSTMGVYDCFGTWNRASFTAHPKIDPGSNEMIIQGYDSVKPFYSVGTISADGERVVHQVDLDTERTTLSHDVAITERFIIAPDFPLLIEINHIQKGKSLIAFEEDSFARLWVIPRSFGDGSNSVRSFPVEMGFTFHFFNSYEDANEIVIFGLRSRNSFLNCDATLDRVDWYRRGITLCDDQGQSQMGCDPLIDGLLRTYIHEWRINMETGTVAERSLTDDDNYSYMEMPRINEAYTGRKYRYGYLLGSDYERSMKSGMPYYGKILKVDFSSIEDGKGPLRTQIHELGPQRYGSEPMFVAKQDAIDEDDGWIIAYVHDEGTHQSEAIIIDAQRFEEEPIARILLPQRVPFGFHGTYVYS